MTFGYVGRNGDRSILDLSGQAIWLSFRKCGNKAVALNGEVGGLAPDLQIAITINLNHYLTPRT